MSLARTGKKLTDETKKKMSLAQKGRIFSEETREKLRKVNTGKTHTEETKKKLSQRKISDETKKKMSAARIGVEPWNKGKEIILTKLWLDSQEKSHSKTYEINNNGNVARITNLSKYCRNFGINERGLRSAHRKGMSYRGISIKLIDNLV